MMRVITVLALTLILLLTMAVGTSSRVTPYPESEAPGGDDHPWGGEYTIGDPSGYDSFTVQTTTYITGIIGVDILFNQVVLNDKLRTILYTTSATPTEGTCIEKEQVSTSRKYIGRCSTYKKGNR